MISKILIDILNKKLNLEEFLDKLYSIITQYKIADFFFIKYKNNLDKSLLNINSLIYKEKTITVNSHQLKIKNILDNLDTSKLLKPHFFYNTKILNSNINTILYIPLILENEKMVHLYFINIEKEFTKEQVEKIFIIANLIYLHTEKCLLKKRYNSIINRFYSILESMQEGVITIDKDFRIININRAGLNILSLEKEDVIGKFCDDIFVDMQIEDEPNYKGKCYLKYQLTNYKTLKTYYLRFKVIDKVKYLKLIPSILYEKGEITGFVVIFSDISKRKEIENLKKDIITSVSHELRTPLTSIKGYIDTILHPKASFSVDDIKDFLHIVKHETKRLEKLINDLLTVSNLEKTKFELYFQIVNLSEFMKDLTDKFVLVHKSKYRFKINLEEKPLICKLDTKQFEYSIFQILNNAVKFSPPLSTIKITLKESLNEAIIIIEDEGIGMEREEVNKIFDKFYRIDKRNTRIAYGLGLGLFITKKIIQGHNGNIWVESEKNKGSKFYISIPLVKINDIINI